MSLERRNRRNPTPSGRQRLRSEELQEVTPVFSYRARRSEQPAGSSRLLQRDAIAADSKRLGRFWLQRFGLLILLLAIVVSVVNVLSLSTNPEIMPLSNQSSAKVLLRSTAVYQAAASKWLSQSVWNRNKVTIDTMTLSTDLLRQFPELSSASISLPLIGHRPVVYLQAADPALILIAQNGSFVVADSGKVLLKSAQLSSAEQAVLPRVTEQGNTRPAVNQQVLSSTTVSFIQTVVAQLAARHVTISAMTLPAGSRELDTSIAGQPYFVKFNLESNTPRQQAGTFLATQAELASQHITPAQYVDVRVAGRAYYK